MKNRKVNTKQLFESGRTETFSDSFFAIAITLLALGLKVPGFEEGNLWAALLKLWPSLVAFLFSFAYIGIIWTKHHSLFDHIRYVDRNVLYINFIVLLTTVLLAFPTSVLADAFQGNNKVDKGVAVTLYAVMAGLMSLARVPIYEYFKNHPELLEKHSNPLYFKTRRVRPWIGVFSYGLAAVVGRFIPLFGICVFLLMILYHAWPHDEVNVKNRFGVNVSME